MSVPRLTVEKTAGSSQKLRRRDDGMRRAKLATLNRELPDVYCLTAKTQLTDSKRATNSYPPLLKADWLLLSTCLFIA